MSEMKGLTVLIQLPFKCFWAVFCLTYTIVGRGDWLSKPANIKVENNASVVYVGSSLTVHNPLFFVDNFGLNKLMPCFYWSTSSK